MLSNEEYKKDHFCPMCNKVISSNVCYELVMCMFGGIKTSSVPEVDVEKNKKNIDTCDKCPYSDLS